MNTKGKAAQSNSARRSPYKLRLIKLIHIGKGKLGLDDDMYRGMLQQITGKDSSKAMSIQQLEDVLAHMKARGFDVRTNKHKGKELVSDPQSRLIRHLWLELHRLGAVANPSEEALAAFVKRQTRVESLAWLSTYQAGTVIESLKQWLDRVEEKASS